ESRAPSRTAADPILPDPDLERRLARAHPAALRWKPLLAAFACWVAEEVEPADDHTHRHAPPILETHDREGRLVNRIRHNPAWERVSREVYRRGVVALNYGADPAP